MEDLSSSLSSLSIGNHLIRNLDSLPIEIYRFHLFKHLNKEEILDLRLISKRFFFIVKSHSIKRLVFHRHYQSLRNYWFSTNEPAFLSDHLDICHLRPLSSKSFNILRNLEYLKIVDKNQQLSIQIEQLNKLTKLQILELPEIWVRKRDLCLKLPHLKSLLFTPIIYDQALTLLIDAPELKNLTIKRSSNAALSDSYGKIVKIKHPLNVRFLRIRQLDEFMLNFPNLECLEIESYCSPYLNTQLLELRKLKRFKVCYLEYRSNNHDKIRELFMETEYSLEPRDLDIILNGVRIKEVSKINEHKWKPESIFQRDNFDLLVDNLDVTCVNYNVLKDSLPNKRTSDLLTKYTDVKRLEISSRLKTNDIDELIQFIKGSPNLTILNIFFSSFTQKFYNNLPKICSLTGLKIYGKHINLDFKFILKFPYLMHFETYQDVLIDEKLNLNSLKYLETFEYRIHRYKRKTKRIKIIKTRSNLYAFVGWKNLGIPKDYLSFNEMIEWSNTIRDDVRRKDMQPVSRILNN